MDATFTGNFTAHLVPRVDIGVTILGGVAGATVFAEVDASAELDLSLQARTTGKQADGSAAQTNFGGNVGMSLGVLVNVGAEAELRTSATTMWYKSRTEILPEPFFDKGANLQLFQKTFPLFTVRRIQVELLVFT